jgi:hypothetical protein
MKYAVRGLGLVVSLSLVSVVGLASQSSAQTTTAANVYVQIQGSAGAVYGYHASSTGKLTAITGSPFKPAGLPVAGTSTRFYTIGQTLLHSYAVGSNGAVGSQLAQMPFLDYAGSSCNDGLKGDDGAVLDHTGKYIYVKLEDNDGACAAYQSYKINSDGSFAFDGDTELNWNGNGDSATAPSILGNESFAYANYDYLNSGPVVIGFRRESSGTLELIQFHETDPTLNGDYYVSGNPDASPVGNYLVLQLHPSGGGSTQLGSYTVDSQGNISSTNTSSAIPTTSFVGPGTTFSPSGNLFAAYADGTETNGKSGIEIYKFNGAAPLTLYKTLLSGTPIEEVKFDSSNHMYAISRADNKLYVFTVTSTSVTEDSSISISSPWDMVVISQ